MSWFHPVEEFQVGAVLAYEDGHPEARYLIEFPDGESYVCVYFTSWESENTGELDVEMDDPRYEDALPLDYRYFPAKITDLDTGTIVYPASDAT